jgi:hypothetical protein
LNFAAAAMLAAGLCWSGIQRAASQQTTKQQALIVGYPNPAIIITGSGQRYGGIIYVSVYAAGPSASTAPVATSELGPSARSVWQLPLGVYEVRYGMREGGNLKTFIVRDVILRPEGATSLVVEMNADAKTTIIGGDMSVQEMQSAIKRLSTDVSGLRSDVDQLKKK